jgi:hypothetical protein
MVYPSLKKNVVNSQTLQQCYFYLLRKRRIAWEFDNKFLNDNVASIVAEIFFECVTENHVTGHFGVVSYKILALH